MQELEKNQDEEINEAKLIEALSEISGKPTDPTRIKDIAQGVMMGNKSVSRQ